MVKIISHPTGYKNINMIQEHYEKLINKGFHHDEIVDKITYYKGYKPIDDILKTHQAVEELLHFVFSPRTSISQTPGTLFSEQEIEKMLRISHSSAQTDNQEIQDAQPIRRHKPIL